MTTFRTGQAVWLNGRAASFCYEVGPRTAVIRYGGERGTRVVPLRKLAAASPTEGAGDPLGTPHSGASMTDGIDPDGTRRKALEAFLADRVAEGYRIETQEDTHAIVVRGDSFPRRLLGRRRFVVQVDERGIVSRRPAQRIRH